MKKKTASTQEQQLIKEIAERITKRQQLAYDIGLRIHKLIKLRGGVKYGDNTIEDLSNHPKIDCSSEQLRRYLDYYRLFKEYGADIKKVGGDISPSYHYQLARLLALKMPENKQRKLILDYAKWIKDHRDQSLPVTVEIFAKVVSGVIESIKNGDRQGAENEKAENAKKANKGPKSSIGKVMAFREDGLKEVADWYTAFADEKHLHETTPKLAETRCEAKRMGDAHMALLDYLAEIDDPDNIRPILQAILTHAETLLAGLDRKKNAQQAA